MLASSWGGEGVKFIFLHCIIIIKKNKKKIPKIW